MWSQLGKKQKIYYIMMHIFRVFPINKKKIVIESFFGHGYGDNAKYIVEELLKIEPSYRIVWLIDKNIVKAMPSYIESTNIGSLKALFHLSTAKVWIDNCRKSVYTCKRKEQFYIQTWHGAIGVKKCEKDAEDNLGTEYIRSCKHDSEMVDVILSNSKWGTELIKRAFWYDGTILEVGSPRNDVFFGDISVIKSKVYEYYRLKNKIALYAPTFRNDYSFEAYQIDFDALALQLKERFGSEYNILVRLHPNISNKALELILPENVVNVTDYPDMQELLAASDILLTDYSSSMFEFMLKKMPVFLIALDYKRFKENERELYFDLQKLPFPFCESMDGLLKSIKQYDENNYYLALNQFYNEIGLAEYGTASIKTAKLIQKVCTRKEN